MAETRLAESRQMESRDGAALRGSVRRERAGGEGFVVMPYLQNLLDPSPTGHDGQVADSQALPEVWMSAVEMKLFLRSERK